MTGSPWVTAKPSAGIATESEKAEALMRWQPVQWQAMASSGLALTFSRTCPQRHPPSHGKSGWLIDWSPPVLDPRFAKT
jgi:hypothetical protein